jgi:predicted solute-binding protein
LRARESIVDQHCRSLGLPAPFLREYLHFNIDYDLGAKHIEGLKKFYQLAFAAGLIGAIKPLRFLPLEIEVESPAR